MNVITHMPLIDTSLQRGVASAMAFPSRFNGFLKEIQTAKAVRNIFCAEHPSLKRGVNEMKHLKLKSIQAGQFGLPFIVWPSSFTFTPRAYEN
ncbi:MAG: hypothetical protein AB1705_13300 [Verrucomicrobiota bacterium]